MLYSAPSTAATRAALYEAVSRGRPRPLPLLPSLLLLLPPPFIMRSKRSRASVVRPVFPRARIAALSAVTLGATPSACMRSNMRSTCAQFPAWEHAAMACV